MSKRRPSAIVICILILLMLTACSNNSTTNPTPIGVPTIMDKQNRDNQGLFWNNVPTQTAIPATSVPPTPTMAIVPTKAPTPIPSTATTNEANIVSTVKAKVTNLEVGGLVTTASFMDENNGWVARGGKILATQDGGKSWQNRYTTPDKITDLKFVSLSKGWATFEDKLFSTDDGGTIWQPKVFKVNNQDVTWAKFADAKRGWIYKRTISPIAYFTFDGGQTWKILDFPCENNPFNGLNFFNSTDGFLACSGNGAKPHNLWQKLYKTSDNGQTWQEIPIRANSFTHLDNFSSSFFLNDKLGWLGSTPDPEYGTLSFTKDGGQTWVNIAGFRGQVNDLLFISPKIGFVEINKDYTVVVLKTVDGGSSWSQIYPDLSPTDAFKFFDKLNGVGVYNLTNRTALLKTSDGGVTWTPLSPIENDFGGHIIDISFVNAQQWWALCLTSDNTTGWINKLYHTEDGGTTWQTLFFNQYNNGYGENPHNISFVDSQNGYLSSYNFVWVTHDGGKTFEKQENSGALNKLKFINNIVGWKIDGNRLLSTTNGGGSWSPALWQRYLLQFDLIDEHQIWVITGKTDVKAGGFDMYNSVDGGKSWTLYSFDKLYPYNVAFADAKHGWIRAEYGYLYATTDGGSSWVQLH